MVINPAPLLRLNDADAQAGQIQSSNGQAEQQAIEGIGGREATGGPLEATGLLVTEGFESARSASRTHPGFWRTSARHSPRTRDHPAAQAGRSAPDGLVPRLLLKSTPPGRSGSLKPGGQSSLTAEIGWPGR